MKKSISTPPQSHPNKKRLSQVIKSIRNSPELEDLNEEQLKRVASAVLAEKYTQKLKFKRNG